MTRVKCNRCFRNCSIPEGERGACWIVGNEGGEVKLLEYGMVSTMAVGPVEEKGIFHFHPGMRVLSIGGYGCNLRCSFCQNYEISQVGVQEGARYLSPEDVIERADEYGVDGIAFTYSEPLIWTEYVIDVFRAAREAGLYRVLKTGGAASKEVFRAVMEETDAVNIDFKGSFMKYDEVCGVSPGSGGTGEIMNNIYLAGESDVNLEMTVLVYGDTDLSEEGDFSIDISYLYSELEFNHRIPIHLVGILPNYRMKGLPPSRDDMSRAAEIARECFSHVYVHESDFPNDTACPFCEETIITRKGLAVGSSKVKDGSFPCCDRFSWERVWIEPQCRSMTTSAEAAT